MESSKVDLPAHTLPRESMPGFMKMCYRNSILHSSLGQILPDQLPIPIVRLILFHFLKSIGDQAGAQVVDGKSSL